MRKCPYCDSDDVEYLGMADGQGDYGTAICDEYKCYECGGIFEGDCIDDGHPEGW